MQCKVRVVTVNVHRRVCVQGHLLQMYSNKVFQNSRQSVTTFLPHLR